MKLKQIADNTQLKDVPALQNYYGTQNQLRLSAVPEWVYIADASNPATGVISIASGKRTGRYEYRTTAPINVREPGIDAKGDAVTDDTAAIQKAINQASVACRPVLPGNANPYRGVIGVVYIPTGHYIISDTIKVPGSVRVVGDGRQSYGGTLIDQKQPQKHAFQLQPDLYSVTGNSCAFIEKIGFVFSVSTPVQSAAMIYAGRDSNNGYNSIYIQDCWFQGPEKYAIWLEKADDVKINNCTFDGAGTQAVGFMFGTPWDAAAIVKNVAVSNCIFYFMRGGVGYIPHVEGFLFNDNRIYGDADNRIPFVVDAISFAAVHPKRVVITDCILDYTSLLYRTYSNNFTVSNNTATNCNSRMVEIGGGGVVSWAQIRANTFVGVWTNAINQGGNLTPDAPIYAYGTGVVGLVVDGIIDGGSTSSVAVYMPDIRTTACQLDAITTGFSQAYSVANPFQNIKAYKPLTPLFQETVSTNGWDSTTFNQIVPAGTLAAGQAYLMKLFYTKSGLDEVVQTVVFGVSNTYAPSTESVSPTLLIGNATSYSNVGRSIKVRNKLGGATTGLEANLSNVDMAGGSLTITIAPML